MSNSSISSANSEQGPSTKLPTTGDQIRIPLHEDFDSDDSDQSTFPSNENLQGLEIYCENSIYFVL